MPLIAKHRLEGAAAILEGAIASAGELPAVKKKPFDACTTDAATLQSVETDLALGGRLGVSSTPTVFLGRVENGALLVKARVVGAKPVAVFSAALDMILAEK